jgi:hypothetical protein
MGPEEEILAVASLIVKIEGTMVPNLVIRKTQKQEQNKASNVATL